MGTPIPRSPGHSENSVAGQGSLKGGRAVDRHVVGEFFVGRETRHARPSRLVPRSLFQKADQAAIRDVDHVQGSHLVGAGEPNPTGLAPTQPPLGNDRDRTPSRVARHVYGHPGPFEQSSGRRLHFLFGRKSDRAAEPAVAGAHGAVDDVAALSRISWRCGRTRMPCPSSCTGKPRQPRARSELVTRSSKSRKPCGCRNPACRRRSSCGPQGRLAPRESLNDKGVSGCRLRLAGASLPLCLRTANAPISE